MFSRETSLKVIFSPNLKMYNAVKQVNRDKMQEHLTIKTIY